MIDSDLTPEPLSPSHPRLLHYTTMAGFKAIVESRSLRATSIHCLNDEEEFSGYFQTLLRKMIVEVVAKTGIGAVDAWDLALRGTAHGIAHPFVFSMSQPGGTHTGDDGLLSQWRAYGTDGGVAIEFCTERLEALLARERLRHSYLTLRLADVRYYSTNAAANAAISANDNAKRDLVTCLDGLLSRELRTIFKAEKIEGAHDGQRDKFAKLVVLSAIRACLHKHIGFSEEREVRIVAIPALESLLQDRAADGRPCSRKPIHLDTGSHGETPRIFLPEKDSGWREPLPIRRVIIGPHRDRAARRWIVHDWLYRHGIRLPEDDIVVSSIPYVMR